MPAKLNALLYKDTNLMSKVKSFYEVNIDFQVWQDNIYKIPCKVKQLEVLINPEKKSPFIETFAERLYTLCSVMQERPYI